MNYVNQFWIFVNQFYDNSLKHHRWLAYIKVFDQINKFLLLFKLFKHITLLMLNVYNFLSFLLLIIFSYSLIISAASLHFSTLSAFPMKSLSSHCSQPMSKFLSFLITSC